MRAVAPVRVYGAERVPREGGVVLAFNHFHWLDPPVFGAASPRTVYFMAKVEAHRVPGLGQLIRSFGTFAVRRGESDREAVRRMREVVADGHALGLFVEGLRGLGVRIEERPDGFAVRGVPARPRGGTLDAAGDHRLAMLGAVAGLVSREGVRVEGAEAVAISFPGFFELLDSVTTR